MNLPGPPAGPTSSPPVASTASGPTNGAARSAPPPTAWPSPWNFGHYVVRERRFTLGRQYRVFDAAGTMVAYAKQKWFRLKEAFTFFTDETQAQVAFTVKAVKVFDFNANMEVRDAAGNLLGSVRRKGWSSIVADHWQILGADGGMVGELFEPQGRGLARRMLTRLIPYHAEVRSPAGAVAQIKARFQFWGDTYDVRVQQRLVDGRVLLGLLIVVDALQEERGSILPNLMGGT